MERIYKLANLWNWLPAFRTVAELEHLPSAAKRLHVSPSAVSRSVKQLEQELGEPLFDREGTGARKMKLNRAGEQLLIAVRDAMRMVDDALAAVSSTTGAATVHIAGPPAWLQLIAMPAALDAAARGPRIPVELHDGPLRDPARALLRGEVDLVLSETPLDAAGLETEHLGSVMFALCSNGERLPADAELPLAVWTGGREAWPACGRRDVALRSPHLGVLLEACCSGRVQAVLPVAIARARGLVALRSAQLPSGQLYLVRRTPLGASVFESLVQAVRARGARVLRRPASGAETRPARRRPPDTSTTSATSSSSPRASGAAGGSE